MYLQSQYVSIRKTFLINVTHIDTLGHRVKADKQVWKNIPIQLPEVVSLLKVCIPYKALLNLLADYEM